MSALGTEFKFMFEVTTPDGVSVSECDFQVKVYCYKDKTVTFEKKDNIHVKYITNNSYTVIVDKESAYKIGRGNVLMSLIIHIPDDDFLDGFRTEVYEDICTGVKIV